MDHRNPAGTPRPPASTLKRRSRITFGSLVAVGAAVAIFSGTGDPDYVAPGEDSSTTGGTNGEGGSVSEPEVIFSEDGDSITPLPGEGFVFSGTNGDGFSSGG